MIHVLRMEPSITINCLTDLIIDIHSVELSIIVSAIGNLLDLTRTLILFIFIKNTEIGESNSQKFCQLTKQEAIKCFNECIF